MGVGGKWEFVYCLFELIHFVFFLELNFIEFQRIKSYPRTKKKDSSKPVKFLSMCYTVVSAPSNAFLFSDDCRKTKKTSGSKLH